MELEIQDCVNAIKRLATGRNGDDHDDYTHGCASAAQILMTADTASLAVAIRRMSVDDALSVAAAVRFLARVTPVAAAMGRSPWGVVDLS